jgi:hypothetical protein
MKLFSWFIKVDNSSKTQKENSTTTSSEELERTLDDELNTFNNNTMWPIAKVKTTTMMMKKPVKKEIIYSNIKSTKSKNLLPDLNLVTIP